VARRCYRLAGTCFDLAISRKLNELGDELNEKAVTWETAAQQGRHEEIKDDD
jgi:hypothetical protein